MDLSAIVGATTNNISDAGTSQTVEIAMLKKAIDLDVQSAAALIAAIPQNPATPNLPATLGHNINTTA